MKLKEMKNSEFNLLDGISFFDGMPNTSSYFNELMYLYGNRTIVQAVEELFILEGVLSVGRLFDLKSLEWEDLQNLSNVINEDISTSRTVTVNKTNQANTQKTGSTIQENENKEYVVPFDEVEDYKQGGNTRSDQYDNTETLASDDEGTTETVYSGFSKEKIEYLTMMFKNYPNFRYKIYGDIVSMLCLQVYDYNV